MLKRLRRKFIVIVMALVGTVLVAVLGSTFVSSLQAQRDLIDRSLAHSLYFGMDARPLLGALPRERERQGGLLTLLVEISDEGIVLEVSDATARVDTDALSAVAERVVTAGETEGRDAEASIAWRAIALEDGGWRIAIVDTSPSEAILREQALRDLQIVAVALAALFAITWWLSDWALRPVEQAWEQQRRFVADASHELKTPIAVILANLQILGSDEALDEDARRWVESSADEANHMKALVGDLLQLARADESVTGSAQGAMRHTDIDLSEMVESAALEFDAVAFERGCLIETRVEEGLHLSGDPEWVERLVRILIDNACKYAERGSTIDVTLAREGNHASYAVHNLGTPIDEEDLPHVFDRFYRSDKARSREGAGGFGLGLAIAKSIAEAHGGTIGVTSAERTGTTFTVTL